METRYIFLIDERRELISTIQSMFWSKLTKLDRYESLMRRDTDFVMRAEPIWNRLESFNTRSHSSLDTFFIHAKLVIDLQNLKIQIGSIFHDSLSSFYDFRIFLLSNLLIQIFRFKFENATEIRKSTSLSRLGNFPLSINHSVHKYYHWN